MYKIFIILTNFSQLSRFMSNFIGIRHEDKYELETRAPLTPKHVERLVKQKKLDFVVQSSEKRIFKDEEYVKSGAKISKDLKKCEQTRRLQPFKKGLVC